jgi:hypothetical protein
MARDGDRTQRKKQKKKMYSRELPGVLLQQGASSSTNLSSLVDCGP